MKWRGGGVLNDIISCNILISLFWCFTCLHTLPCYRLYYQSQKQDSGLLLCTIISNNMNIILHFVWHFILTRYLHSLELILYEPWTWEKNINLFILFLFQVARALQPSVFYIGDCERMFKKKLPKTDLVCIFQTSIAILIDILFMSIYLCKYKIILVFLFSFLCKSKEILTGRKCLWR